MPFLPHDPKLAAEYEAALAARDTERLLDVLIALSWRGECTRELLRRALLDQRSARPPLQQR